MNIDERLAALTRKLELMSMEREKDNEHIRELPALSDKDGENIRALAAIAEKDGEHIRALAALAEIHIAERDADRDRINKLLRIAESHERRLKGLEGGEQL